MFGRKCEECAERRGAEELRQRRAIEEDLVAHVSSACLKLGIIYGVNTTLFDGFSYFVEASVLWNKGIPRSGARVQLRLEGELVNTCYSPIAYPELSLSALAVAMCRIRKSARKIQSCLEFFGGPV